MTEENEIDKARKSLIEGAHQEWFFEKKVFMLPTEEFQLSFDQFKEKAIELGLGLAHQQDRPSGGVVVTTYPIISDGIHLLSLSPELSRLRFDERPDA